MKKITVAVLSMCLALSLAGCTQNDKNKVTNETTKSSEKPSYSDSAQNVTNGSDDENSAVAALASQAKDKIKFSSALEDQGDAVKLTYSMDSTVTDAAGWCAMSGTEQIAVFKVADGMSGDAETKAKAYIDYLIDGYSSYGPEEVPKLKKAVIKTYGDILVVCVSDDENAAKTLDGIF